MESALTTSFVFYGLNLKFRHFETTFFHELEFLDVLHVSDENSRIGFVTKDFKKPAVQKIVASLMASHAIHHTFLDQLCMANALE